MLQSNVNFGQSRSPPALPGATEQPVSQSTLPAGLQVQIPRLLQSWSQRRLSPNLRNSAQFNGTYLEAYITYHSPTQKKQQKRLQVLTVAGELAGQPVRGDTKNHLWERTSSHFSFTPLHRAMPFPWDCVTFMLLLE